MRSGLFGPARESPRAPPETLKPLNETVPPNEIPVLSEIEVAELASSETATGETEQARSEAEYERFIWANLKRNYAANYLHGMLGMTGFRLVNAPTFVPAYLYILASHGLGFLPAGLRMLASPNAIVGLGLSLQQVGQVVSPIIGAAQIEHRKRVLPASILMGTLMRVQILGMAFAGWFFSGAPLLGRHAVLSSDARPLLRRPAGGLPAGAGQGDPHSPGAGGCRPGATSRAASSPRPSPMPPAATSSAAARSRFRAISWAQRLQERLFDHLLPGLRADQPGPHRLPAFDPRAGSAEGEAPYAGERSAARPAGPVTLGPGLRLLHAGPDLRRGRANRRALLHPLCRGHPAFAERGDAGHLRPGQSGRRHRLEPALGLSGRQVGFPFQLPDRALVLDRRHGAAHPQPHHASLSSWPSPSWARPVPATR